MTPRQRNKWKRRLDRAQRRMARGMAVALKAEFARVAREAGAGQWTVEAHRKRIEAILLRWWLATAQGARVVVDEMLGAERAALRTRDEPDAEDVAKVLAIVAASVAANADVAAVVAIMEAQPAVVAAVKGALVAAGGDATVAAATVVNLPAVAEPLAATVAKVAPNAPRPVLPGQPPALPPPPGGPPRLPPPPGGTTPLPPGDWDELIAQELKKQAANRSRKIAQGTQQAVSDILEQAARGGLGEEAARKRLEATLPDLSAARVRTIARTEVNAAQNSAAVVSAEAKGKPYLMQWLAIDDGRTRPTHLAADGQEVARGEKFRVGSALLDHPGDPNGPPGEVINCRCTMLMLPAPT